MKIRELAVGSWQVKIRELAVGKIEPSSVGMTEEGVGGQDGSVRSIMDSGWAVGFGSFSDGTLSRRTAPAKRLSK